MIDYLGLTKEHKILDYGASKGFLVKALRLLHRQAWGCDISRYAINSADNNTRQYLKQCDFILVPWEIEFDFIISKDVFEHIKEQELNELLPVLRKYSKNMFVVVPLGEDGKFNIPAYQLDVTHTTAMNKEWWIALFMKAGWELKDFSYCVPGIKDNWSNFSEGNGFFWFK